MKPKKLLIKLMLDSGVFTAWNRNETLDLKRYIAYIKEHEQYLFSYVNMDVIPGTHGVKRTQRELDDSAKRGYANLQKMKDAGLRPIPVFHQGEKFDTLERMLKDGETYMGISTAKDIWASEQRSWLDTVFSVVTDKTGKPLIKTHGFGITNPKLLFRYPWYTCDSTTWSLTPGYGQIIVPLYRKGKPDYSLPPLRVIMSGLTHQSSSNQKRQFHAMGKMAQDSIRTFLEVECGMSVGKARYGTTLRRKCVLIYYLRFVEALPAVVFRDRHPGIMGDINLKQSDIHKVTVPPFELMYATSLNREWSVLMNDVAANTRLLSYYELKDRPSSDLVDFVTKGLCGHPEYVKRVPKMDWDNPSYLNFRRLALLNRMERYNALGSETSA